MPSFFTYCINIIGVLVPVISGTIGDAICTRPASAKRVLANGATRQSSCTTLIVKSTRRNTHVLLMPVPIATGVLFSVQKQRQLPLFPFCWLSWRLYGSTSAYFRLKTGQVRGTLLLL